MNFLAHIYLSGDDDLLKIGNFAADSVKGKNYRKYPERMQQGILLHRKIDRFTDTHPTVHQSSGRFFADYGHYNGVIVDVLYDHFLAKNWKDYHQEPLADFVQDFYILLNENFELLPKKVQRFLPYMIADNWLLSYASIEGIEKILWQMNRRVKAPIELHESIELFKENYETMEEEFTSFFEELMEYVKLQLKKGIQLR